MNRPDRTARSAQKALAALLAFVFAFAFYKAAPPDAHAILHGLVAKTGLIGKSANAADVPHSSTSIHGGHTLVTSGDSLGGFMSGADKTKLDGIASGAQVVSAANVQTATAALSSALNVNGQKISNLATPTAGTDAVNKTYADSLVGGATVASRAVDVRVVISAALPANTYANGTFGVGATITANANGTFPTVNGLTLAPPDKFIYHGGSIENGVYDLVSAGSGGSAWSAVRDPALDTAAEMQSANVHSIYTGANWVYKAKKTVVMGTTNIFLHNTDPGIGMRLGMRCSDDFLQEAIPTLNTPTGPCSFQITSNVGTVTIGANNLTNGVIGSFSFSRNATAASYIGVSENGGGASTGGAFVYGVNVDEELDFRWQSPVASDGTNTYALMIGAVNVLTASAKLPVNGIAFVTDNTSGVSTTNILAVTAAAGVSTGTVIDTGVANTAATWFRGHISHDAGDTDYRFELQGNLVATLSSNIPTVSLGEQEMLYGSAGGGTPNGLLVDWMSKDVQFPQGRAN